MAVNVGGSTSSGICSIDNNDDVVGHDHHHPPPPPPTKYIILEYQDFSENQHIISQRFLCNLNGFECRKIFDSIDEFHRHEDWHRVENLKNANLFKCLLKRCSEKFASPEELNDHIDKSHFRCENCKQKLETDRKHCRHCKNCLENDSDYSSLSSSSSTSSSVLSDLAVVDDFDDDLDSETNDDDEHVNGLPPVPT